MKKILIILLFPLFTFAQSTIKYSKARIYYQKPSDLELLYASGVAVDHGLNKKNVFFESVFSTNEINIAKNLGFKTEIIIEDMKKHIHQLKNNYSNRNSSPCDLNSSNYVTPTNFNLGSMGGFYTLSEMIQELDDMKSLYPNLITEKLPISNFTTYEGRSIYWVKISDNPEVDEAEPEILFTAIHHAREPASMQQLIYYMWYLLENYQTDNEIKAIVDNTEQYFIPIVNPDGYHYNETTDPNGGGMWRKNRRPTTNGNFGVDNNRNYGYHFGESGVSGPNGETYPGTTPFSEVENQATKWFTEQHHFEMAINNHTYSGLLLYPFGYASNIPTPDNAIYEAISSQMVAKNGYTNELSSELYPAAGDSDDWMYGDTSTKNKIFSMTAEIGDSFWPSQAEIIPLCKNMLYQNITAAHLITNYAKIEETSPAFVSNLTNSITYDITRLGLHEPANFIVELQPLSANISSVGNTENHLNMNLLQTDTRSISYTLNPSIQSGDEISFKLLIDNGQFISEKVITKLYGNPQLIYNENGNSLANFNATNWQTTNNEYYSANSSLTDSPFGNYDNNSTNILTSNSQIDLTNVSLAKLFFYAKWNIEKGWDYVQFEISSDNGATWIPQCGKYTSEGNQNQQIQGEPMYDGEQNDWVKEEIDLSDYLGQQITYRFQLVSDNYVTEDGFYVDDINVEVFPLSTANTIDNSINSITVYPNPSSGIVHINTLNNVDALSLSVYSLEGKLIKKQVLNKQQNTIDISTLESGMYFINLKSDKATKTIKIIKT